MGVIGLAPSPTDLPGAHPDAAMATVVDRHGDVVVRAVIHQILIDGVPCRTAAADYDVAALDGGRIGTVAGEFLEKLNPQDGG